MLDRDASAESANAIDVSGVDRLGVIDEPVEPSSGISRFTASKTFSARRIDSLYVA